MDHLCFLNDIPPPPSPREHGIDASAHKDFTDYYLRHCGRGLDRLFETWWYTSQGLDCLLADPRLSALCIQAMKTRAEGTQSIAEGHVPELVAYPLGSSSPSLEAFVIWQLALMPRSLAHDSGSNARKTDLMLQELLPRIDIVESLLTGQYLAEERIPLPPKSSLEGRSDEEERKASEQSFWYNLGWFTALQSGPAELSGTDQIQKPLVAMRSMLAMLENRDVLYSIAIARSVNAQTHNSYAQNSNLNQKEEAKKLRIAQDFVQTEERRGTSQVIQRICSMALRSWSLEKHAQ